MNLFGLIMISVVLLLVFIFWLIMKFIKDVKDVRRGKVVVLPIPTQITTKDKNFRVRFGLGIITLVFMTGFLYFTTTSSILFVIGKAGQFIVWIVLFLLLYLITKIPRRCKLDGLKLEELTKDTRWRYYRCPQRHISMEIIVSMGGH